MTTVDDDLVKARLDLHDGSKIEGTVPWHNKGWTLIPYGGVWFRFGYFEDGWSVFLECKNICEDFKATAHHPPPQQGGTE